MLYNVVLFLHILVVLCAFGLIGILATSQWLMHPAETVAELRRLAKPGKLGGLFGPIVLLLLGLGSWLVALSRSPDRFHFSDPFVYTAIATLVVLMVLGLTIELPHQKRLETALATAPDGPISAEIRALALDKGTAYASAISNFLVLGVVFNMVNKPSAAGCIGVLAAAVALGTATALLQTAYRGKSGS